MTVYVLDASAFLRYVDSEPGASRVNAVLKTCVADQARVCISAVQWGEVAGNIRKRMGATEELRILSSILPSEVEIVPLSGERAVRAAGLRIDRKIAYADAIALELAMSFKDQVFLTADYGFKDVTDLAQIEFLPLK
jgi:predicted nucleic acid-binding protein